MEWLDNSVDRSSCYQGVVEMEVNRYMRKDKGECMKSVRMMDHLAVHYSSCRSDSIHNETRYTIMGENLGKPSQ